MLGRGYGAPFGGDALIPVTDPTTKVGDLPITYDFTDETDGAPLPGVWERFAVTTNGSSLSAIAEAAPDTYFKAMSGLGLWAYNKTAGNPFTERGYAASPSGVLTTRNAELAVALKSPHLLLRDARALQGVDSFVLDVTLAMRANDDLTRYVGARLRAQWSAGAWQPAVLEAVLSNGTAPPGVLATATLPPLNEPGDVWENNVRHELRLRVVDGAVTASLDGVYEATGTVSQANASNKPGLLVRSYVLLGSALTPLPAIVAFQLRTLRDSARPGGAPLIQGQVFDLEAPQLPTIQLPMDELTDNGYFKRTGGRSWECILEVETDTFGVRRLWKPGNIVRSLEEFAPGLLPVVPDLGHLRGERTREAGG